MPNPSVIIKVVVFSILDGKLRIFLKNEKLINSSLISRMKLDEIAQKAFELGLRVKLEKKYLEQLYTLSSNNQIQVIYYILVPSCEISRKLQSDFSLINNNNTPDAEIISYALQRLKWKIEYTNAVYSLLPGEFTLSDLQSVYEAILGIVLDKRNFRKKILSLNIIEPTGHILNLGRARPAEMFRFRKKELEFVKIL